MVSVEGPALIDSFRMFRKPQQVILHLCSGRRRDGDVQAGCGCSWGGEGRSCYEEGGTGGQVGSVQ